MTPNDLDLYLKVMKDNGVVAGVLRVPNEFQLQVNFAEAEPKFIGADPVPGGWKGAPAHLDAAQEYAEEKLP